MKIPHKQVSQYKFFIKQYIRKSVEFKNGIYNIGTNHELRNKTCRLEKYENSKFLRLGPSQADELSSAIIVSHVLAGLILAIVLVSLAIVAFWKRSSLKNLRNNAAIPLDSLPRMPMLTLNISNRSSQDSYRFTNLDTFEKALEAPNQLIADYRNSILLFKNQKCLYKRYWYIMYNR